MFALMLLRMRMVDKQDFTEQECVDHLRFRRQDLPRLQRALRIPETVTLPNRVSVSGEEALCILLYRLAYPVRFATMAVFFQRSSSTLCRVFRWVLDHVFTEQRHRVQDYLRFWHPRFPALANAVRRKRIKLGLAGVDESHRHIVGFIDGTLRKCSRPTSVPNLDVQRVLYNGWKKVHAIKFQSVELPNGMCADLFGPVCGAHNDNFLLRLSAFPDRMMRLQAAPARITYKIYGDSAYPLYNNITRPYKGNNVTRVQQRINGVFSKLRVCVEWGFAANANLFSFADFPRQMRMFVSPIGRIYVVCVLLRNAYACLYGNETSTFFKITPPSLEEYFEVQ
jgi:hypothetical protein